MRTEMSAPELSSSFTDTLNGEGCTVQGQEPAPSQRLQCEDALVAVHKVPNLLT